ncbi:hypothetical protein [Actinomycetospora cinnamomea]|uniref:Uncharacterized protein n=1 Tax=Actinomycetospora cinnamomea TaxID=663609 RepID=A0A2U1FLM2_9PSEU|nr:hypothetical protein [Actinomycetospora cinnamomea]PVZ13074.1 hypothetical protein C8D89_102224 [Actinomycetospora cinnamomea]
MTLAPPASAAAVPHDVRRLARLVEGLAAGSETVPPRRAQAIDEWVGQTCAELRTEHDPDLCGLVDEVRRGTRTVVRALLERPATVATPDDFARMRTLARRLDELAALLDGVEREVPAGRRGRRVRRRVFGT